MERGQRAELDPGAHRHLQPRRLFQRPATDDHRAVVAVIVGLVLAGLLEDVIELPEVIGAAASLAVPFVIGDNVRRRRNELAELAERADRAERQRELLAAQRVGEERTRIARDLTTSWPTPSAPS